MNTALIREVMKKAKCSRSAARKRIANFEAGKISQDRLFVNYAEKRKQRMAAIKARMSAPIKKPSTKQISEPTQTHKCSCSSHHEKTFQSLSKSELKSLLIGKFWILSKNLSAIQDADFELFFEQIYQHHYERLEDCFELLNFVLKMISNLPTQSRQAS